MVLKFCGGLWSQSRTDDDVDVASNRQQRLQELLRGSAPTTKFTKEVRVAFDPSDSHGLTLSPAEDDDHESGYTCVVAKMESQTAQYNARCKALGDYSLVLVEGMRVRAINDTDQHGVAFEDIVQRIRKTCASGRYAITFADVSARPPSPKPTLKTVGNLVLMAHKEQSSTLKSAATTVARRSSTAACPLGLSSGRSVFNAQASPKVSKWSTVLTTVSETVKANHASAQSDVLASDLTRKNVHLEAQLLVIKGRLAGLEREKAALEAQRNASNTEMIELLQTLETERQRAQAQQVEANDLAADTTLRVSILQHENDAFRSDAAALQSAMESLQHEHDATQLQMQELHTEHCDLQHQTEELHARLVAAQLLKSELQEQITLLQHANRKDHVALDAIQRELPPAEQAGTATTNIALGQRRRSSVSTIAKADDSAVIATLKRTVQAHETLQAQHGELQIELSCHEMTLQHQQERILELEEKLGATSQISSSLRDQVRSLMMVAQPVVEVDAHASTTATPSSSSDHEELARQLTAERSANARLRAALQALEDNARAKLAHHEKQQVALAQFKEQLVKGIAVTKYGSRGHPHARVLYSDLHCRWISWRDPTIKSATCPRSDAKAETLDLVEVLLGATTETFQQHKPEVPARCVSLVFCHPCRTLDVEMETRERALFLRRGFRLLLDDAAEKRRRQEDNDVGARSQ